ncbi:phytoene desaturase family protein [Micrococcoides hystricis]|uniref:Phytoene desaturase family protein n=1 Tax=Micrococcoides hystricis TaxID=1572761 RepID=A0ABV6PCJ3_9MICC
MRVNVIGGGLNGLSAACRLAAAGAEVTVFEADQRLGGAARSADVFGNGSVVDLGAAAHPTGVISPAFKHLNVEEHGVRWIHPKYPLAHPIASDKTALLEQDVQRTLDLLPAADHRAWRSLHESVALNPARAAQNLFGPLTRWPEDLGFMARFGLRALLPARTTANRIFSSAEARALFTGSAAHPIVPPQHPFTSAVGILFGGLGMTTGWPVVAGGTQTLVDALASVLSDHGGTILTNRPIVDLRELPPADATVLNLTPHQILALRGVELSSLQRRLLAHWRYGPSVSKADFLLQGLVPWLDERIASAGTIHLVGTADELLAAESAVVNGRVANRPFVMVSQQQAADPTRSPREDQHVLSSYAHVPRGYNGSVLKSIINQFERFAPGFSQRVLAVHESPPRVLEAWNPNLVDGDIGGGSLSGLQQFVRPLPSFHPYRLKKRQLYMASAATPPGGGAHGMAGWHAASSLLNDLGA